MNTILVVIFGMTFWVLIGALVHFTQEEMIETLKEENLPVNQRPLWQVAIALILVKGAINRTGDQLRNGLDERNLKLTEAFKKWPLMVAVALIRLLGIMSVAKTRLNDFSQNNTMHKVRKVRAENKKMMEKILFEADKAENKIDDLTEEMEEIYGVLKKANHPDEELGKQALEVLAKIKNEKFSKIKDGIEKHRRLLEKQAQAVLEDEEIDESERLIKASRENLFNVIDTCLNDINEMRCGVDKVQSPIRFW